MAGKFGLSLLVFEIAAMAAAKIVDDPHRKAAIQQQSTMWLPIKPAPPVTTAIVLDIRPLAGASGGEH